MVVKNWTFSSSPTYPNSADFKWVMSFNPAALAAGDNMVPAQSNGVYGDLINQSTLYGQNTSPPSEKVFGFHFIVKKTGVAGGPYFDPSYGVTYSNAADFESKAIDGYLKNIGGEFRVRKPGGGTNITLNP
jgi:hypothetical protein